jgi:hypothetical protein
MSVKGFHFAIVGSGSELNATLLDEKFASPFINERPETVMRTVEFSMNCCKDGKNV